MKKETIHFIITGGTIDSYYDGTKDTAVTNKKMKVIYTGRFISIFNKK